MSEEKGKAPKLKICDFGLSKIENREVFSVDNMGTAEYMCIYKDTQEKD